MKKSSTFLLIVAFIISIFFISSMGIAASNSHMKKYFTKVEITDCKVIKGAGGDRKIASVQFDSDGETIYEIKYRLTPDPETGDVTEADAFEFRFDNDGGTHLDGEGNEQPNAILNKNIVTFLAKTTVVVRLQTLDGSNCYDRITIYCLL